MISPDHAHALADIIAPFKCGLALHLQLKMLGLRAGCWDSFHTSINTTCPQCDNDQHLTVVHILDCPERDTDTYHKLTTLAEAIIGDIEDAFGEEGDLQKGVVVWQAVMLGWLPSVIQIEEEKFIFIHINQMDQRFFNQLKELYTGVIEFFNNSVSTTRQLLNQ